jgi:SulP family sulfate permease
MPAPKHVLIVGNGINELDTSGVDTLETLIDRLHGQGLGMSFSGLNDAVLDTMRRTGLLAKVGEENIFRNATRAIKSIWKTAHEGSDEEKCPLAVRPIKTLKVAEAQKRWRSVTRDESSDDKPMKND